MPSRIFLLGRHRCPEKLEKAFYWTERAAQHGDRDAQFNLGWFYENGIVVPKDLKWAERWYVRAASQRQKEALEKLKRLNKQNSPERKTPGRFQVQMSAMMV